MDIDSIVAHVSKNFLARPQYYTVTINGSSTAPNKGAGGKGLASSAGGLAGSAIGSLLGAGSPLNQGLNSLLNPQTTNGKQTQQNNGKVPDASVDVMMNCSAISIPGMNIGFTPEKRFGLGTTASYPNAKSFTELNLTFYESQYENERSYFSKWVDMIYNKSTRKWGYYNDYVKTVTISQFDRGNNLVYSVQLLEAWPSSLSPLSRGYALDTPSQFDIGFQFSDMKEVFVAQPSNGFGLNLATFAQLSQIVQSFTGPNAKNTNISGIPGMPQILPPAKVPTIGGIASIFPNLL